MKEVPTQYKKIINQCTTRMITEAEKMWPFICELGDTYQAVSGDITIIIMKTKNGKKKPDSS
jgi:hypothetical protein